MTRSPKIILAVSLAVFAAGLFVCFGGVAFAPAWSVTLPLGTVGLGWFLITLMMKNEMAGFDLEMAQKLTPARVSARPGCNHCPNCRSKPEGHHEDKHCHSPKNYGH